MNRLEATLALTKIIAPTNTNFAKIKNELSDYSQKEWELIVSVANADLLIPLLYKSLVDKNLLCYIEKDKELLGYLTEFYLLNEDRNRNILKQLIHICNECETINVKPILLKGAAALTEKHYKSIGERVMSDIDFVVPDNKIMETINLLKSLGYKEIEAPYKLKDNWYHYKPLWHDKYRASVEVHRSLLDEYSMEFFPSKDKNIYKQSTTIKNALVLTPIYELYHSFLHTELHHENYHYKHFAIRQLQHFSVISDKYKDDIDYKYLAQLAKKYSIENMWNSYLILQKYFFETKIDFEIKSNLKVEQHIEELKERLYKRDSKYLKIKSFYRFLKISLSYKELQNKYKLKYKSLLPIYIVIRILHAIYIYLTSKTRRNYLSSKLR